ncbi:MAG: 50S ribosomal protein L34e [Nanoarchaeota archaeon]
MTVQQRRSRSFRKVHKKLPGGRVVVQYRERRLGKAHCAWCGKTLIGVPQERPPEMKQIPRSQRRPERPYGGVLCSPCLRKAMIMKARNGVK